MNAPSVRLSRHGEPIAAVATAPGRGAVGIVRLSGRSLAPLVQGLLGRVPPARVATYLPFPDAQGTPLDHGLAIYFAAPHSYTGEDVLELQAHGGPVVLQLLLARCLEVGAPFGLRVAEPGEFTQRAFLNDKLDLAQAEAVADLIDASTEAAARSAGRSLSGAFSREVEALAEQLVALRTLVEATLDFPEEEIDFLEKARARPRLEAAMQALQALQSRARQGALLREGLRVVLAGQPNVGKSSLLNALAGAELAIVTPVPGTTRDRVSETLQIRGVPLHITDTAGLRATPADEVERIGIGRSWEAIGQADVVVFLHDLTRLGLPDYDAAEAQIAAALPVGVPVLHVLNKVDAAQGPNTPPAPATVPGLRVSAREGQGLEALREALLEHAGWQASSEGVFIARTRHLQALQEALLHLEQAMAHALQRDAALDLLAEELRLAHGALGRITGAMTADELLGRIFSTFCIGK
ncbi:MAG: tRNA uridine-5-carboxymethylaminomethyl(34) synthesis GTPase MnmE [Rubrivivax sp.]